jgi:hypothetical protein
MMREPTHCIMYIPNDRSDPKEVCGRCLDHPLEKGYSNCMTMISIGYCFKNRKTPVLP